jgi:hypothetical protein
VGISPQPERNRSGIFCLEDEPIKEGAGFKALWPGFSLSFDPLGTGDTSKKFILNLAR